MALEEILPSIYGLRMGYVNAFLLAEGEGLMLIDSGLPNRKETILRALSQVKRSPEELKHIAITHHHSDHAGSLAALAQATGARVYVHAADAAIVRGERPAPGPNPDSLLGRLLHPLVKRVALFMADPARVDQEVQDGDELPVAGGLKAVHTPGHTAGHMAYLMPGHGGVLFVGDAAGNLFGRLGPPTIGMYTEDVAQARESIRKLAALEFDAACFGHGRVLKGKANVAFRRLVEKLAR